jgi:3-oxoacyl-[acyl-carrier-protein] synthase II
MSGALAEAQLTHKDVDCVFAAANGSPKGDISEAEAIRAVFGKESLPPITAPKSMLGETYSAGGAFAAAAALCALDRQAIPPTINYGTPDPLCSASSLVTTTRERLMRHVLVNAAGPGGNNSSLVISKFFS